MDLFTKTNYFRFKAAQISTPQEDLKSLTSTPDQTQITPENIQTIFAPYVQTISREKNITNFHKELDNLANQIDMVFTHPLAKNPENLNALKSVLNQITWTNIAGSKNYLSSKSHLLSSLLPEFNSQPSIPSATETASPAPAQETNPSPLKIDVKKMQQDLSLASRIVIGIKNAIAKPGANTNLLLWRLNKYRLTPMAQIFNQLLQQNPATLPKDQQDLFINLKGLFDQVIKTFNPDNLKTLQQDPQVAKALDASKNAGLKQSI